MVGIQVRRPNRGCDSGCSSNHAASKHESGFAAKPICAGNGGIEFEPGDARIVHE
jgi:hypothetical protein